MRALTISMLFALPTTCLADRHQEAVFSCTANASDQMAFLDCTELDSERCNRVGNHVLDYDPQISCFREISDEVLRLQNELKSEITGRQDTRSLEHRLASLTKALGVGDLECEYQDTLVRIDSGQVDERSQLRSLESCRAMFYLTAYWTNVFRGRDQ